MWFQAVLPKTLFLIIFFQTLNNQAFGAAPASVSFGSDLASLINSYFGVEDTGEISLEKLVNLHKIPKGTSKMKNVASVTIKGIVPSDPNRFNVDLIDATKTTDFHMSLRFPQEHTIFNSYSYKKKIVSLPLYYAREVEYLDWDEEVEYEELVLKPWEEFEIIISTTEDSFQIEMNGQIYSFEYRAQVENLKFIRIEGDVMTTSVKWNGMDNLLFDTDDIKIKNPIYANIVTLDKIPPEINAAKNLVSVTINGIAATDADRFVVDLIDTSGQIGFHISLRFPEDTIVFNSNRKHKERVTNWTGYVKVSKEIDVEEWDEEETYKELPIKPGQEFKIIISTIIGDSLFKIDINEKSYLFTFRMPLENLLFMRTEGDALVTSTHWEGLSD